MLIRLLGVILFIIILPIMILISLLIIICDGKPIFFVQKRIGKNGKTFKIYKYRTMIINAQKLKTKWKKNDLKLWNEYEQNNFKLQNDPRITKSGRWLRKSSLDELPQIFNIIKGNMSFIGPRPIMLREKKYYGKSFRYYIKTTPGITGLWQISGRSDTKFKDRAKLDRYYISNKSLKINLWILYKTFLVILLKKGAY